MLLWYYCIMKNEKNVVPKVEYDKVINENKNLQIELDNVKLELNNLKRVIFGSKREKTPKPEQNVNTEQCSIFDNEKDIEKNVQEQLKNNIEEITVYRKKKSKKRTSGIKKSFLSNIIVKRQEYIMNEGATCPICDSDVELVGKKVIRSEIEFDPAVLRIKEHIQYIYKCKKCGTEESEKETPTFLDTEVPKPLLTHSFVSPSLATEVFYQKYYLGVPLYRQEKMWDDKGLVLPRNMMANWAIKINEYYLELLWKLMHKRLKEECELLHRR